MTLPQLSLEVRAHIKNLLIPYPTLPLYLNANLLFNINNKFFQ